MKKNILYSEHFRKSKIRGSLFLTNKTNIDKDYDYILITTSEKIPDKCAKKESCIVIFDLLNVKNTLSYYCENGITNFVPSLHLHDEFYKYLYSYKKILENFLLLPKNTKVRFDKKNIILDVYGETINIKKYIDEKEEEKLYLQLLGIEIENIKKHEKEKINKFSRYFKDIVLRKTASSETIKEDLGENYVELYDYFHNIQEKYFNMYGEVKNLQSRFEKLFVTFPGPVAIFNPDLTIEKENRAFRRIFPKIKRLNEIEKYEKEELKVFKNFDKKIKNGIVKILTDKYYVLKFEIEKLEEKYVIYFTDITENTMFEIVSLIKLTFEDAEKSNENLEDFANYVTKILKDLFGINSFIEIKDRGNVQKFGKPNLKKPYILSSQNSKIKIGLEFGEEFHPYDKKEVAKSLIKACTSKMFSDKIKNYNKKIENDLKMAKLIQKSLIENENNFLEPQYSLYYKASSIIGGDFASINRSERTFNFAIGDVSGHGIASALMSIFVNTIVKEIMKTKNKDPIKKISRYVKENLTTVNFPEYMFAAMIYARMNLEKNTLEYLSGGFQFPILIKRGTEIIEIPTGGGIFSSAFDFEQEYNSIDMEENDLVLTFTDGLIELNNDTDSILQYVKRTLSNIETTNPDIIIKIILKKLKEKYKIKNFEDDITILALRKSRKSFDIIEDGNIIYGNSNIVDKKSEEKYFIELIKSIDEKFNIDKDLLEKLRKTSKRIITEREKNIREIGAVKSNCNLKMEVYKERNNLIIKLSLCTDPEENRNHLHKMHSILSDLPIAGTSVKNREITLALKM